jgi:hypothetical protein
MQMRVRLEGSEFKLKAFRSGQESRTKTTIRKLEIRNLRREEAAGRRVTLREEPTTQGAQATKRDG